MKVLNVLKKLYRWYNPFYFNNKEVLSFNIYDPATQEILIKTKWFTNDDMVNPREKISFNFTINESNRVDLTKKRAFFVNCDDLISMDIYIPASMVKLKKIGTKKEINNGNSVYYTLYEIKVNKETILLKEK